MSCRTGPGGAGPSNVEFDLDLERAATTSVSTLLVIVYDVMADWWDGVD